MGASQVKNKISFKLLLIIAMVVIAVSGASFAWLSYQKELEKKDGIISNVGLYVKVEDNIVVEDEPPTVLPGQPVLSKAFISKRHPDEEQDALDTHPKTDCYCRFRINFDLLRLVKNFDDGTKTLIYDAESDDDTLKDYSVVPDEFDAWFISLNGSIMEFYAGDGLDQGGSTPSDGDYVFHRTDVANLRFGYGWEIVPYEYKDKNGQQQIISYYYLVHQKIDSKQLTKNLVRVNNDRKYVISKAISFPLKPDFVFSPDKNLDVTFKLTIICQTIQADYLYDKNGNEVPTINITGSVDNTTNGMQNVGNSAYDNLGTVAEIMNEMSYDNIERYEEPGEPEIEQTAISFTYRILV